MLPYGYTSHRSSNLITHQVIIIAVINLLTVIAISFVYTWDARSLKPWWLEAERTVVRRKWTVYI